MSSKSLLNNSLYNMLYKGLNIIFPLVTVTYVSRILLPAGVGKVSYAQNIAQYFVTLAALGIPNYGIREIAKRRESREETSKTFSELFTINLISTIAFTLLYYTMISVFPAFKENYFLSLIVGSSIALNVINVDWFYQGVEEYQYIAIRSFVVKIISLIMVFAFIREPGDMVIYAGINCLAVCGNNVLNIINLRKFDIRLSFKGLNLKPHMKPIFLLLASVISVELYTLLDTTMVGAICDDDSVAYYTNSMKLIKLLITFITAIGGVLLPRLSYYHMNNEEEKCSEVVSKVFSIMLFLFVPCQIGIFMLSDEMVRLLFGQAFAPAGITLKIASFLICTLGFSNLFGTQVLLTYGKEKLLLMTTIGGAVSNIVLNSILIPAYAQNGAAFASVISETIVTILSFILASKYIRVSLDKRYIADMLISGAALVLVITGIVNLMDSYILKIALSVVFGGIAYIGINICAKNPILADLVSALKKKS